MRLKTRIHEWLADHVSWVQYPTYKREYSPSLLYRYQVLTGKERGWFWFFVFWGCVVALSIFGNIID